jgi:hypothetical protein
MNDTANRETKTTQKMFDYIQKEGPAVLLEKIWTHYVENASIDKMNDISRFENGLTCAILRDIAAKNDGVFIDFKHGEPTTDQVFNAVYGKGAKSRLRVILYDGERSQNDRRNPAADYIIVESFVDSMNSYGANIYLAKVGLGVEGLYRM